MTIEVRQDAKLRLIELGYDPALGARPLRRAVQREVEDQLSELMIAGKLPTSSHVVVDFVDGKFTFDSKVRETATI